MGTPEELNAQFEAAASAAAGSMAERIKARRAAARGASGPDSQPQPPTGGPDAGREILDLASIENKINIVVGQFRLKAATVRSLFASGSYDEAVAGYEGLRNLKIFQDFSDEQMSLVNQQNPRLLEAWNEERSTILTNLQNDKIHREVRDANARAGKKGKEKEDIVDRERVYSEDLKKWVIDFDQEKVKEATDDSIRKLEDIKGAYISRLTIYVKLRESHGFDQAETQKYKDDGDRMVHSMEVTIIDLRRKLQDKVSAERQEALKKVEPLLEQLDISVRKLEALRNPDGLISADKIASAKELQEQIRVAIAGLSNDDLRKAGKHDKSVYENLYDFTNIIRESEKAMAASGGSAGTGVDKAKELEDARKALALAQKRVEDLQKLGHGLMSFLRRGSRDQVNAELAKAKAGYEAKLKEATMADRAVMIDERMKLVDAKLAAYRGGREKRTLYERYKGLSEYNLDNWLQKRGVNLADKGFFGKVAKRGARMVNARTAVSIGLFGGMVASGAYLGVGAGLAVARVRGAWSGVGAGAGTYEMINLARRALSGNLSDKQIGEMSAEQAVQYMASYEARASLDGTDLSKNAEYQKLVARYKSAIETKGKKADGTELVGQELYDSVKASLNMENTGQRKEISKERWIRRAAFVAGAVVGGTMYNYIVNKVQAVAEAERAQLAKAQARAPAIGDFSERGFKAHLPPDVDIESPDVIKGSGLPLEDPEVTNEFPPEIFRRPVPPEELLQPTSAGAAPEAAPIRADMEVTVKPGGAVTETPVKITEQTPVPKPDNVIYGEGLSESPPGVGAAQTAVEGQSGAGIAKNISEIKAGATMEVGAAGDAIVHAGKRGIEGALIDLKNTDPDRYAKMLAKLQEHYQAPNGKFENLVHRFVLDNSDGKDLNRVFSADIHISPDGELTMGDVKLMPPAESAEGLAPETNPSLKGPSFAENFDRPNPLEKFQFGDKPATGFAIPKPTFGVDIKDLHTPGALDTNPVAFDYDDSTPRMNASELTQHAREVAADSILSTEKIAGRVEKLSDALHLVLGNKYDTFLKNDLGISARSLNELKNISVGDFLDKMEKGKLSLGKFKKFAEYLTGVQEQMVDNGVDIKDRKITRVLIDIAKEKVRK